MQIFQEFQGKVRAYYILAYAEDFRAALIIAKEIGLLTGQYAFIGSAFGTTLYNKFKYKPEYGVELYEGVLQREIWTRTGPVWDNYVQEVIQNFNDPHFNGYPHIFPGDDPSSVNFYAGKDLCFSTISL